MSKEGEAHGGEIVGSFCETGHGYRMSHPNEKMNLIIEIIDGVAYAVEEAKTITEACDKCFFAGKYCDGWCEKRHSTTTYFRRLTQTEREELIKAIGRGME